MEVAKDFYFVSIGIKEINDGIENAKRFRIVTMHLVYMTIFALIPTLLLY